MSYWQDRIVASQRSIADRTIDEIEGQLKIYYANAMKRVIRDFEVTYNKLLATIADGRVPTPADLYKLDAYWQMQAQLSKELERLGAREIALLSQEFEKEWLDVYNSFAIATDAGFNTVSQKAAQTALATTWLADGKHFSERIWGNTAKLIETLNEQLVDAVITGKTTRQMAMELQNRFDVSYRQAKTLVRTEVAHIQVQAASQRYQDAGLTYYEFLGRDEHDIGCKCKQLNGKIFKYADMVVGKNAPPLHPNCRCDIIPVIDDKKVEEEIMENERKERLEQIKKYYPDAIDAKKSDIETEIRAEIYDMQDIMIESNKYMGFKWRNTAMGERYGKAYKHAAERRKLLKDRLEHTTEMAEKSIIDDYIFCIDCGKPIERAGHATSAVKRCPECQETYRKHYKAQKERERRLKKKLNKKQ